MSDWTEMTDAEFDAMIAEEKKVREAEARYYRLIEALDKLAEGHRAPDGAKAYLTDENVDQENTVGYVEGGKDTVAYWNSMFNSAEDAASMRWIDAGLGDDRPVGDVVRAVNNS